MRINNDCSTLPKRNSVTNQQVFKIKKSLNFLESNSFNDLEIAFPDNLQGDWQYMTISKNLLTYRDESSLKTFYMSLVTILEADKYIVRSRSQCGEENYKCIIITQLHDNVIETQISSKTLSSFTNYEICNNKNFNTKEWVTQASKSSEKLEFDMNFHSHVLKLIFFSYRNWRKCDKGKVPHLWKIFR